MKLILALISVLAFTNFIQDEKSQKILDNLSEMAVENTSFYTEFNVNINNSTTNIDVNESGKGWVKDDKFYSVFGNNEIISNGIVIHTIIEEEKVVYRSDADEEDDEILNPKKIMTLWESGFTNEYGKETILNEEVVHLIYLYPTKPANVDYQTISLFISKSANELKKVVLKMKDETTMTYLITKYISNPLIDESMFIYNQRNYPGYTLVRNN